MSKLALLPVRQPDRDAALAEFGDTVNKSDVLGILLRGWRKLGPRQKLEAMKGELPADTSSEPELSPT